MLPRPPTLTPYPTPSRSRCGGGGGGGGGGVAGGGGGGAGEGEFRVGVGGADDVLSKEKKKDEHVTGDGGSARDTKDIRERVQKANTEVGKRSRRMDLIRIQDNEPR